MDHPTDVTDEVTAQRLALSSGQVLSLEPVLITLLLPKPYLTTGHKLEASSMVTELRGRTGLNRYPGGHEQQLSLHVRC